MATGLRVNFCVHRGVPRSSQGKAQPSQKPITHWSPLDQGFSGKEFCSRLRGHRVSVSATQPSLESVSPVWASGLSHRAVLTAQCSVAAHSSDLMISSVTSGFVSKVHRDDGLC